MIRSVPSFATLAAMLLVPAAPSCAQSPETAGPATTPAASPHRGPAQNPVRVFHLRYAAQQNEANEILVALRNILEPTDKMYLLTTSYDIVVTASPEQLDLADSLIKQLDHPKPAYRLTYTLAESDNGKRVGVQHFTMIVVPGQRVMLKQGDKIPVVTGSYGKDKDSQETQFTYLDIGVNLDTTIDQFAGGLRLRSKVEQSSVAPVHQTIMDVDEPIVRQSVLEGTSVITPGKPLNLGGIDVVGSTRHIDIEVVAEPLA